MTAAIRSALKGVAEDATDLVVFLDPDFAIEDKSLPALAVMTGGSEEDDEYSTLMDRCFRYRYSVVVLVAKSTDPGSTIDGYAQALRAAVDVDPTLAGVAINTIFAGIGDPDFDLGDCAQLRLNFDVISS